VPNLMKAATGFGVAICLAVTALAPALAQPATFSLRQASPTGSYIAGTAALNSLNAGAAARLFMQAAQADWDNPYYTGRAFLAYLVAGRIADAAAIAQHLAEIDPQNELARLALGVVALKQRRYTTASQVPDGLQEHGQHTLAGVLRRLPDIERQVVELRMGLVDGIPAKHKEVGERLGLTIHEVRTIEERAFSRIREVVPVQGLQRFLNR
jgi:tetratricopeptide (TPR) repeat protein